MNEIPDDVLLRHYVNDDSHTAFEQLVARYQRPVYHNCMRRLANDHSMAEDATQIVFVILAQRAPSIRNGRCLPSWLRQTARSVSVDILRREHRRRIREQAIFGDDNMRIAALSCPWSDVWALLPTVVNNLEPMLRTVIVRHFYHGETQRSIAVTLGCAPETINRRVARGIKQLRQSLSQR